MAVIFRREVKYEEAASASLLEHEYEAMIEWNAPTIFPGLLLIPFKTPVTSDTGTRKPDFALIEREYRTWWVVEVELAHHSFAGHVLPQIEVLSRALYGEPEADYLARQNPTLDVARLRAMMLGDQPRTLVIVNEPTPHWEPDLRMLDAVLVSVALFRSDLNDYVLLMEGRLPRVQTDLLTRCRRSRLIPRLWEVESPGALPSDAAVPLVIEFDGRIATWRRIDSKDSVYLAPEGASDSLGAATTVVELVRIDGERLEFRPPT